MTKHSHKPMLSTIAMRLSRLSLLGVGLGVGISMASTAHAFSTSDQCDYQEGGSNWRVTNVRSNDVLNMRRDPDPKSGKIHTLPYNASNIEVICCVKKARGADWCLAQQRSTGKSGWISKRFVTQSYGSNSTTYRQPSRTSSNNRRSANYVSPYINDNYARLLVEKMYREYGHVNAGSDRKFFRTFVHSRYLDQYLANIAGAHPLYLNQDTAEVSNLQIVNDPNYPTQNGNYYVRVSFVTSPYSPPTDVIYRLQVDNSNQRLRIVDYDIYRPY